MKDALESNKHTIQIREGGINRTVSLAQDQFVIGREGSRVDIQITNTDISRRHVAVRISGSQIFITDLKSGNGTFIEEKRIDPEKEVLLINSEVPISLGNVAFLIITPRKTETERLPEKIPDFFTDAQQEVDQFKAKAIAEIETIQAGAVEFAEKIKTEAIRETDELKASIEAEKVNLSQLREQSRQHERLAEESLSFENRAREARLALETLENRASAVKSEVRDLTETLEREKKVQIADERHRKAIGEALEAEFEVKRLSLEAAVGEADLKRLETLRQLQLLLDQQQDLQRNVNLATERMTALEQAEASARSNAEEAQLAEGARERENLRVTNEVNEARKTVEALQLTASGLAQDIEIADARLTAARAEAAERESSRIAALNSELQERSERRERESQALLVDERRRKALEEAQDAEYSLKRLTLETKISEMEREHLEASKELKALLGQKKSIQSEVDLATERKAALAIAVAEVESKSEAVQMETAAGERERLRVNTEVKEAQRTLEALNQAASELRQDIVEAKAKVVAAQTEALEVSGHLEQERSSLNRVKAEVREITEALEHANRAQIADERHREALGKAHEAEFLVKRLSLEATLGEVDIKRLEAARELQALLDRQQNIRRDVAQATEKKTALETTAEAARLRIESAQSEATSLKLQIETEEASLTAIRKQTEKNKEDLLVIQLALKDCKQAFEREKASQSAQLSSEEHGARERLSSEIKLLKQTAQDQITKEYSERGRAMERELADAKLRELNIIARMQEDEEKAAHARLQYTLDEIVKCAIDLTQSKPLDQAEVELRTAVKAALMGKTASSRSAEGAERTRKYWKNKGIQAAIPIAAGIFFALFPSLPGAVRDHVLRTIASEKNDSGVFLEQIRQRGMKYQPEMDHNYRDTYSANLLYLENYAEMKLSTEEEKSWTLILNDLIVGRLGLSDRIIPDFISAEAVMVRELFRIREGILPQYLDQGLAHLAEAEKLEGGKLLKLLQTPENYQKFRSLEKSYYLDFINRKTAPAASH